jgi:PX domain-containing protein kinase-like protein
MALRSDPRFEMVKPIDEMGWRLRKHYFMVRHSGGDKGDNLILSWEPHGPDQHLDPRQLNKIVSVISNLEVTLEYFL